MSVEPISVADLDEIVKPYFDLSEIERTLMTPEQVSRLGVTLSAQANRTPKCRPTENLIKIIQCDLVAYSVVGDGAPTDLVFATKEDALTFISLSVGKRDYGYDAYHAKEKYFSVPDKADWGVMESAIYSENVYRSILPALVQNSRLAAAHKGAVSDAIVEEQNHNKILTKIFTDHTQLLVLLKEAEAVADFRARAGQVVADSECDSISLLVQEKFGVEKTLTADRLLARIADYKKQAAEPKEAQ